LPKASEVGFREKVGGAPIIVPVAVADLVASATDLAVTVTVGGLGTVAGAVYFPVASIVPQPAPVHPIPERLQVTA